MSLNKHRQLRVTSSGRCKGWETALSLGVLAMANPVGASEPIHFRSLCFGRGSTRKRVPMMGELQCVDFHRLVEGRLLSTTRQSRDRWESESGCNIIAAIQMGQFIMATEEGKPVSSAVYSDPMEIRQLLAA